MLTRRTVLAGLAAAAAPTASLAQAPDKLKVAISQRGFWDSSFLEFAQKARFLKEANLDVEFFYTEGGGQTLQVITGGSVDVAMSNGLLGTIGAFSKNAPIRAISAQMTGAHEISGTSRPTARSAASRTPTTRPLRSRRLARRRT